jgi:hypothetical protein
MESIVGIFNSPGVAEQAVEDLIERDIPEQSLTLLSSKELHPSRVRTTVEKPDLAASESTLDKVPTMPAESSGSGKTSGATVGGWIGGAAGFTAGATAASLMVPGLGVIFAAGLGAAALLGLGGAAAGSKLGDTVEDEVDKGVPKEEVEFYRELLRRGRSLVIANVRSGSDISTVREVFRQLGSEDTETARRELRNAA